MIRVLIVDDHAVVRRGLAQLLATTDDLFLAGEAADGDIAVGMAAELRPDVVLMDLSMPNLEGVSTIARILAAQPDLHILVLTSFSDHNQILDALQAGAKGYLLKHAEPETILSGIREVMAGLSPLDPKAARALLTGRRAPRPGPELSDREGEVLELVGEGLSNRSIARSLGITERTVKAHLTSIYQQLGVTDRTQAALWVQRQTQTPGPSGEGAGTPAG
jgi:DNA-binding NarL/FixJ family response regulator